MTIGPRHYGIELSGTARDRTEYMRDYMAKHSHGGRARHTPSTAHSIYDVARRELRDGSGTLMWPERIKGSETSYSDGNAAIDAAERRRLQPPAPDEKPRPQRRAEPRPGFIRVTEEGVA